MRTRRLKLALLVLIALFWFIVIIPYLLVQTRYGANLVAHYFTDNSSYSWQIGTLSHSLTTPKEITLNDVIITDKQSGKLVVESNKLVVGFSPHALWQTQILDYIIIQDGQLKIAQIDTRPLPVSSQRLQLLDVAVHIDLPEIKAYLTHVKGGIKPYITPPMQADNTTEFMFTAESLQTEQLTVNAVIISGFEKKDTLYINNLGGNLNKGFFISKGKQLADKSWQIDELQINHFTLNNDKNLTQWLPNLAQLPRFTIGYVNVLDSSISLPDLQIEKANLQVRNLRYDKGWQWQDGRFDFNAQSLVWQDELLLEPSIQGQLVDDKVIVEKAASHWQDGLIAFDGFWRDNQLWIDNAFISGIHYTLPEQWQSAFSSFTLPKRLSEVRVENFTLRPSIVLDTQIDFPMQFTYIEASGQHLHLAHQQQLGLWQGDLTLKVNHATLNTVPLRYAELKLQAKDDSTISSVAQDVLITGKFNSLSANGLIDGTFTLKPKTKQIVDLHLAGHAADPQLLKLWRLVNNPAGGHTFAVDLQGHYAPLTLSGSMTQRAAGQTQRYQIQQNRRLVAAVSEIETP